jgi:Gram-negative bacterial TonB protein C-terminal/PilZ domain
LKQSILKSLDDEMPETTMQPGSVTPKTDRRAHPRQRIQSLTYVELGGGNGGIALNVSEGGMTVVAAQPLDAEGIIDVALQLPQTRKRLAVKGEVRWLSESRKEAGLKFVDLTGEALDDIRAWIAIEAAPVTATVFVPPVPTLRETAPSDADSFFADEEDPAPVETVLPLAETEAVVESAPVESRAVEKAPEVRSEGGPKKFERVFESGHREPEPPAAKTEPIEANAQEEDTIKLEPLTPQPAFEVNARAAESQKPPLSPASNGGARRTPFSQLATDFSAVTTPLPGAKKPKPEPEPETIEQVLDTPDALTPSPLTRFTNPVASGPGAPHPLELPRPVMASTFGSTLGSSFQPHEMAEDGGKDFRIHLQSGWVLGVLTLLLAIISFFSGMAVRRGALNRVLGEGEAYTGMRPNTPLQANAAPPAAAPQNAAPAKQVDIEIVDSTNRRWVIPMIAGGALAPAPAPTAGAENAAATLAQAAPSAAKAAQPSPSTATVPAATNAAAAAPGVNGGNLSDATTADNGQGGLIMTLPETPVAASSLVAISAQRFIPIPAEAAAKSRNLQVGSLVNLVEPTYPPEAMQQNVEGTIKMRGTIAADGSMKTLDVETGPKALMTTSLTAVRSWRYNPTLLNGKPIETEEEITIVFRLPR